MSKINQLNLAKKFAEKNIRNLWFRPSHKTSYCGHFRFQYKQIGRNRLDVFDLFHDIAHAVDFILLGKIDRLTKIDFGFIVDTVGDNDQSAMRRMLLECRTTAIQFILLKHFGQISCLDYFLKVEKHKLFSIDGAIFAFKEVADLTNSLPLEEVETIDWGAVDVIRKKRDKLLLRKITDLIRKELKALSSADVLSALKRLDYLAKRDNFNN